MLKVKKSNILVVVFSCVFFIGCATTTPTDKTQGGLFGGRTTFTQGEIKLPVNSRIENYRKLLMGCYVQKANLIPYTNQLVDPTIFARELSARLETEMTKLKRFSVFAAFNREGVTLFKSLDDIGKARMPRVVKKPELDLILNLDLILSCEVHERAEDNLFIYEVEISASCEDLRTGEVKFSEKAKGQARRVEKISLTGRRMGGYVQADERQAFIQASLRAISVIAAKLGNYYPVGGRITGILGDRVKLDRGFEQGVGNEMQMVVYVLVNGIEVPLGIAEASPAATSSVLKMWRWNTEDEYAAPIIEQMKSDPDWLQKYECYAVSLRMAIPPEWDSDKANLDRVK